MENKAKYFPDIPRTTDQEWERLQPLIEKAKAEGHPLAFAAGIFRDDPSFDDWIEIMRENRRKADVKPNFIEGLYNE